MAKIYDISLFFIYLLVPMKMKIPSEILPPFTNFYNKQYGFMILLFIILEKDKSTTVWHGFKIAFTKWKFNEF